LGSEQPQPEDIVLIKAQEMQTLGMVSPESILLGSLLTRFSLRSRFLRMGFDYDFSETLEVGLDQVVLRGEYREVLAGQPFAMDYNHQATSLHMVQQFSNYVALRGHLNLFNLDYRTRVNGVGGNLNDLKFSLTVAIEFVL